MPKRASTSNALEGHVSGQANKPLSRPAHALHHSKVVEEVGCSPDDGLTAAEAEKRHQEYGNNDLGEDGGPQPGKILLRQVANAMTLVSTVVIPKGCFITDFFTGSYTWNGCQFWNQIVD